MTDEHLLGGEWVVVRAVGWGVNDLLPVGRGDEFTDGGHRRIVGRGSDTAGCGCREECFNSHGDKLAKFAGN